MTITPPLAMRRAASRAPAYVPRTLTCSMRSRKSSSTSIAGPVVGKMPALLTQISSPPSSATAIVGRGRERRRVGDVQPAPEHPTRQRARLPGEVGRGVPVEVAGDDVGSGLGEPAHDLGAETTAGTRHDGAPPA